MKNPNNLLTCPEVTCDDLIFGMVDSFADGSRRLNVLREALSLGLFDMLMNGSTYVEVSKAMSLHPEMTRMFLDCLVDMELLYHDGERYIDSQVARDFLVSSSPLYQGTNLGRLFERMDSWANIDSILRNGPEMAPLESRFGRDWITAIGQGAMGGAIAAMISRMEEVINMSKIESMLDLGGGHGLYAIAICHKYPNISGKVFDRPNILEVTAENIDAYGSDVGMIAGDYYEDPIGGPYDLLFTSFNNACSDPKLVDKIADAVSPGGYLVVRRHRMGTSQRPLVNLEWNFKVSDPSMIGKALHASHINGSDEYDHALGAKGLRKISEEVHDGTSLFIVFHKGE